MKVYWTFGSIQELAELPRSERGRAWRLAYDAISHEPRVRRLFWIAGAAAGVGVLAGQVVDQTVLGAAIGGGAGGFLAAQLLVPHVRRQLRVSRSLDKESTE